MHEADLDLETDGIPADDEATTSYAIRQLTRVEGEGRLDLTVRDGVVTRARLEIFEAPRYFERLVVGRDPERGHRHRGAHLRHLPGRVPDVGGPRVRGPVRRHDRPIGSRAAAALLLRRVDREPRAPRLSPPRARLPRLPERGRDGGRPPGHRRARPAAQEGREPNRRHPGWPADPPGQRPRRWLLPRAVAGRAGAAADRSRHRACRRARDGALGRRPSIHRPASASRGSWRSATRPSTR